MLAGFYKQMLCLVRLLSVALIGILGAGNFFAADSNSMIKILRIANDFPISDFSRPEWKMAEEIEIKTNWDGSPAAHGRHFAARLRYSENGLYVLFRGNQTEEPVVSDKPLLNRKSIGLWDRDVFEIFIAPENRVPERYFEFEVSPLGEWLDVALKIENKERISNWDYDSGLKTAAKIEKGIVMSAIFIPFSALGKTPKIGEIWRGNIFRCIGRDPGRGYLAWMPTFTDVPNFHVPSSFGKFKFFSKK